MKICYVDETGTDGKSPVLVMVGVIADGQRLSRTRTEFSNLFDDLEVPERALFELKSTHLYRGKGPWRNVDGADRHALIGRLCDWLCERKHHLALTAIDLDRHQAHALKGLDAWMCGALHVALQVQRNHQSQKGNKGQTFLVFDEHQQHADALAELLFDPPPWTDEYYGRAKKQEALDQIIDSAFYARSHHVGLVQIADLFAFLFRRYSELNDYGLPEAYDGEAGRIGSWVEQIAGRLMPVAHRWPKRPKCEVAKWYCDAAPPSLVALG